MVPPSLSFVAAVGVAYFLARVLDRRGRGSLFLIVVVLAFQHGEPGVMSAIVVMLPIGALLSLFESVSGGGDDNK